MLKSVVSYPDRGPWGNASWKGNFSGWLVCDLLEFFRPTFFVDPMEGSGTSGQVAASMGIKYRGFDLHSGFNAVRDSLIDRLGGERPDYLIAHPPYHDMILFSGEVWGKEPHPDDLSRCASPEEFLSKLQMALYNAYDALAPNSPYTVVIGDLRKKGKFWSIQSDLIRMMPGVVESVVIKLQHNCRSDKIPQTGNFIRILHEYAITARKDKVVFGMLDAAVASSQGLVSLSNSTWRAVVAWALRKLGGKASLSEIYRTVAEGAAERTIARDHWKAKVRQILQKYFTNIGRGVWQLPEAA